MTADAKPAWWRPGMPDSEVRMWEAAERAAAEAPVIEQGSDTWLRLKPLLAPIGEGIREMRAEQEQKPAA
ncbi:hypothetical protein GCM10023085_46160 [Actinomadura viridis]|uniref:Uncharacterized protein n=1 Tax=Actinomadura viridis TaxID=58110 RepID=A0A931GNW7_9ACTN|nr:hypothetical protein [Actinomadura viridis]MBG6089976.1 hypothetical protein [Actinomadura viridis]